MKLVPKLVMNCLLQITQELYCSPDFILRVMEFYTNNSQDNIGSLNYQGKICAFKPGAFPAPRDPKSADFSSFHLEI